MYYFGSFKASKIEILQYANLFFFILTSGKLCSCTLCAIGHFIHKWKALITISTGFPLFYFYIFCIFVVCSILVVDVSYICLHKYVFHIKSYFLNGLSTAIAKSQKLIHLNNSSSCCFYAISYRKQIMNLKIQKQHCFKLLLIINMGINGSLLNWILLTTNQTHHFPQIRNLANRWN